MEDNREKHGCLKIFLYLCAGLFILFVLGGALEGIGKVLLNLPWYGHIIMTIGFIYLMGIFFGGN